MKYLVLFSFFMLFFIPSTPTKSQQAVQSVLEVICIPTKDFMGKLKEHGKVLISSYHSPTKELSMVVLYDKEDVVVTAIVKDEATCFTDIITSPDYHKDLKHALAPKTKS